MGLPPLFVMRSAGPDPVWSVVAAPGCRLFEIAPESLEAFR
jgi:hypothetical protein